MIIFYQNIKVHQSRYSLLLMACFFPYKALVFFLLAEHHLKHIFKEPTIRNPYQFLNYPSHEWQNWKVDNGSSILGGLVVNLYNSKRLKYCVMILIVARRRVIVMITTEADNDRRLT